jgi:choline trimethylamine-lyase
MVATQQLDQTDLIDRAVAPELRTCNARVTRLYALLQERMLRPQTSWGRELTVLDDPANAALPLVLRHAKAVEKTLLEMPIDIEADDLIVGNSVQEGAIVRTRLPSYATEPEREQAEREGRHIAAGLSHKVPHYPDVLEKGLTGIIRDLEDKIEEIQARPASAERDETLALFQAMRIETQAVIALAHRYADLAERKAATAPSSERRDELLNIARVCRRVPALPPRTFQEAAQSFWLTHYALSATNSAMADGRIDQYLYPALQNELERGALTLDEAQEIVDCLWLRFNDRAQICRENFYRGDEPDHPWEAGHRKRVLLAADLADAINHFGQNVLISGVRPDGADGTTVLTYLCLNAAEKLALTSPVLTVRLHKDSPRRLVRRTAEALKQGGGMPYIDNDDVIVQAYVDLGVPLEDARDYANSNCWETMIAGKSDQELIRGINLLLYLELALNRGISSVHGLMGPDTGDPRQFSSFRALIDAWKAQTDAQIEQAINYIGSGIASGDLEHSGHGRYAYNPLLSALTLDCVQREKDVTRCGARYTIWHVMAEGVANTINALAAIKQCVYEDKTLSMESLLAALGTDWATSEDVRRRIVARVPKFANDNDYADEIGRELMAFFVERTRAHAAKWTPLALFPCSVGTFSWFVSIGREVGATADGRHRGEAIAANFSPVPGTDVSGPASAINSYVKMHVGALAAGAPLDLRISNKGLEGEAGTDRLAGLIEAFVRLGGNILTLTVTDVQELKRAIEEPDQYRHLRVRMGGWSAYFVMLSQEQQRLHIRRIEHGLA